MLTNHSDRKSLIWRPTTTNRRSLSPEFGAAFKGLASTILIVLVTLVAVAFFFGAVVPVGFVGVRKIAFGPGQGLRDHSLLPGYHWTIPGYSTIYQVPQTIQIINFAREESSGTHGTEAFPALDIPTVDGTTVDIDVSVLYRFSAHRQEIDQMHIGGPVDLINNVGATDIQWRKYLSQVLENELKRALGALSTSEFYNPKAREARVKVAEHAMREALAPVGITVDSVLLRRYTYRQEIDQAIFKKNLQELEMAYNQVAGEFADAQKDVNKVEADGDVTIKNLDKQGIGEAEQIRSEGDLYRRRKTAEGDLLIAMARADVDRMRNDVLSKVGSDVYVALQVSQILSSLKGGVVSNIDPYDFDGWVKKLTGSAAVNAMSTGSTSPTIGSGQGENARETRSEQHNE